MIELTEEQFNEIGDFYDELLDEKVPEPEFTNRLYAKFGKEYVDVYVQDFLTILTPKPVEK